MCPEAKNKITLKMEIYTINFVKLIVNTISGLGVTVQQ